MRRSPDTVGAHFDCADNGGRGTITSAMRATAAYFMTLNSRRRPGPLAVSDGSRRYLRGRALRAVGPIGIATVVFCPRFDDHRPRRTLRAGELLRARLGLFPGAEHLHGIGVHAHPPQAVAAVDHDRVLFERHGVVRLGAFRESTVRPTAHSS